MTVSDDMLRQPMAQALGWALLQFLWQGTLIAVLAAALLRLLRQSAADVRYVVSTVALALMLTMPVVTAIQTFGSIGRTDQAFALDAQPLSAATGPVARSSLGGGAPSERAGVGPRPQSNNADRTSVAIQPLEPASLSPIQAALPIERWLPILVSVWLAGVALLTLRLLSGWLWVQRMKRREAHPVHEAIEGMGRRLMRRLHIVRAVRFLESRTVDVPTVIGWLSPAVLLPASVLAGLTPQQIEAILAHELAHIRRHDYLVNLLQAVVETLLFYHPAVWWLSHRIRVERENCCDDLAVSLCGDPVAYAAALAELEGLRSPNRELALAASGGSLLQRVRRLLGAPTHAGRAPGWLAAGVAMLVLAALTVGAMTPEALVGEGVTAHQPATASTPVPAPVRAAPMVAPAPAIATTEPQTVSLRAEAAPVDLAVVATTEPVQLPSTAPVVLPVEADNLAKARAAIAAGAVSTTTEAPTAAAVVATTAERPALAVVGAAIAAIEPAIVSPRATLGQRSSSGGEQSGNYVWSDNGKKLEVNYRGEIEFTADDADVARMSPGAQLRIRDGRGWFGSDAAIEFTADGDGNIQRRFWLGWSERPFEPEGRKWLASMLPRFIRQSGIGAPARVARILKSGGVSGVLAEISRVEGSWGKRVYFSELMKSPGLSAADVQRAFKQAGIEIDSDYELASFLIASNRLVADDGVRRSYLEAARSIGSDYELRRVLASILTTGVVPPPIAAGVLDASLTIDSDYEEASLLVQFAGQQPLEATVRTPFFKALDSIASAYERSRVLKTLLKRTDLSPEARAAALESAVGVNSDYERAAVLTQFVQSNTIEGTLRAPFFRAAGSLGSSYEKSRLLQALAKRTDLADDTVLELLRTAQGVTSNYERAQVLLAIASTQPLTRAGRDAYIDAAEKLGDHEQGRVLSALVRNERRGVTRQ